MHRLQLKRLCMEIYFVNVVGDLILTALIVGVVYAYARDKKGRSGAIVVIVGLVLGIVASLAMAFAKQNTSYINTSLWNQGIFIASFAVALIALVCAIVNAVVRKAGKGGDQSPLSKVLAMAVLLAFTAFMALRVFYMLPDVINYPANFGISADNLVSTDFAYRIIGWLGGFVLVGISCVAVSKAFKALDHRMMGLATGLAIGVICVMQTVTLLQIFMSRRIIPAGTDLYRTVFSLTSWTSNNTLLFTLIVLAIFAALSVFVIVLSFRDKEPYSNPAEHRKNKAKWRNRRRWAICVLVCIALSIATITALKAYATAGPELSPSEECEVHDGNVYVSLEQVEDGHLHRFTYETEAGIVLDNGKESSGGVGGRFIIIQKQNSSAYGVGLDACEICGQTGYYERDGQVVCKLCDVVMNINTIGFKGGCNPIPVEYKVENGYIVFPVEGLAKYEKTFK